MAQPNAVDQSELEWVQLRRDIYDQVETPREKFMRKFKQAPLVPIGCLATAAALSFGLYNFRKGNMKMSQTMMRARIGAQGFTFVALIIGVSMAIAQDRKDK